VLALLPLVATGCGAAVTSSSSRAPRAARENSAPRALALRGSDNRRIAQYREAERANFNPIYGATFSSTRKTACCSWETPDVGVFRFAWSRVVVRVRRAKNDVTS